MPGWVTHPGFLVPTGIIGVIGLSIAGLMFFNYLMADRRSENAESRMLARYPHARLRRWHPRQCTSDETESAQTEVIPAVREPAHQLLGDADRVPVRVTERPIPAPHRAGRRSDDGALPYPLGVRLPPYVTGSTAAGASTAPPSIPQARRASPSARPGPLRKTPA